MPKHFGLSAVGKAYEPHHHTAASFYRLTFYEMHTFHADRNGHNRSLFLLRLFFDRGTCIVAVAVALGQTDRQAKAAPRKVSRISTLIASAVQWV